MNERQRHEEIAEVLRRRLHRALHAGTIAPGDRLPSARELAADFDADQRVLLAAYRELVEDGLVEMRPRGGIYVAPRRGGGASATPPERWLVELLTQGIAHEIPAGDLHEWLRRSVETLRLRAIVVEPQPDLREALCRELFDEYALETTGIDRAAFIAVLGAASSARDANAHALALTLRRADLLVTTTAQATMVCPVAESARIPCLVVDVRPDMLDGEWRLLLREAVYVVVHDARVAETARRFVAGLPGGERARVLVAGVDDLATIPAGAPVHVTRQARARLAGQPIAGRILPAVRLLSTESSRALLAFIVRRNLAAMATLRG